MKRKLIPVLVANLFVAVPAAFAQDFTMGGTIGIGGQWVDKSSTVDEGKLREYRDMSDGVLSVIDLRGRSSRYYLEAYGENIARDDMFLSLKGGAFNLFKYELFSDSLRHYFTTDARSPYAGIGSANQTLNTAAGAVATVGNPATWNLYDLEYKRRNDGGAVEFSFNSPFYVRLDANQIKFDGSKLQAYAKGTSPGNGFVDIATPVDFTTKNISVEGGYATKRMQLSLAYTSSKFENDNPVLRWSNNYFVGLDASPLAPDSDQTRWVGNAVFKQLPLGSTLALRITQSKTDNSVPLLASMLSTGSTNPASNATQPNFNGDVEHTTYSVSLTSNPTRTLDTRLYYNFLEKENKSSIIDFVGLPTGFGCGENARTVGGVAVSDCETEIFGYEKKNFGVDVGWRFMRGNKLTFGYDYADTERHRHDSSETKDHRYSVEYKNTMLGNVSGRVKYQYLDRNANFLQGNVGANANDTLFLQRFVRRFDVADLEQHLVKLGVDVSPAEHVDVGAEVIVRNNDYTDTLLGRTKDDRTEFYVNAAFGDPSVFRVTAFAGYEEVKYDSTHRTINAGACPLVASGTTPASPNCFDPFAPPTSVAFNWAARNKDEYTSFGVGADWPVREWLSIKGSFLYVRSKGSVAVSPQTVTAGAQPVLLPIDNYGNNEKYSFNLKGTYRLSSAIELTGGYSYERMRFNDAQFNGYTYVVPLTPLSATTSYLSGWYANPDYTANIVYLLAKYRF